MIQSATDVEQDCSSFLGHHFEMDLDFVDGTRRSHRLPLWIAGALVALTISLASTVSLLSLAGGSGVTLVPYGVNQNGQTYGSDANATSPTNGPDLIAVYATNGLQGYAYQSAINAADGYNVSSPAAALAWMANGAKVTHYVAVYLSDGTTQIGTFAIGPSNG